VTSFPNKLANKVGIDIENINIKFTGVMIALTLDILLINKEINIPNGYITIKIIFEAILRWIM